MAAGWPDALAAEGALQRREVYLCVESEAAPLYLIKYRLGNVPVFIDGHSQG